MIRILLIEDDNDRVKKKIREWLPPDVHLVHAGSVGRAIGILQRDKDKYG